MTRSHTLFALVAGFLLATGLPALAGHHEAGEHAGHAHDHAAAADPIEIVSTNVQGKNVFIPSTVIVEAGKPRTLSLYNTTDTPHGFTIEVAKVEEVLMPGKEQQIELPALEPGLYKIGCHLHPPHRSAQLLVVEF